MWYLKIVRLMMIDPAKNTMIMMESTSILRITATLARRSMSIVTSLSKSIGTENMAAL
jgi:hypothetical protein